MSDDKFNFGKMIQRLQEAKYSLPSALAQAGQLFFQRNFDKQKWDGVRWEKRNYKNTKAGKYYADKMEAAGKPILVASGKLRQAIQNTVRDFNWHQITWAVDSATVDYAKYLNFGTDKMVARQFMGTSKELNGVFKDKIKKAFDRVMLNR